MSKPQVQIKWDYGVLGAMNKRKMEGLLTMGYDIARLARKNAPVVSGALRNSIRVEDDWRGDRIYVRAGGVVSSGTRGGVNVRRVVNYAWKREMGPNRNPTTEHYMENAQKAIMTGDYLKRYFGGITK